MSEISAFPGFKYLNNTRNTLWENSYRKDKTVTIKIASWFGHKGLSAICLPINTIGIGAGLAGLVITASTIGVIKIAIYTITFGHKKLPIPTGGIYFGQRAFYSLGEGLYNSGELVYDAVVLINNTIRAIRWVGKKLFVESLIDKIIQQIDKIFSIFAKRLGYGLDKTIETEKSFSFSGKTPFITYPIDELTAQYRIDWNNLGERSVSQIFLHTVFSAANVPINAIAAACSGIATLILSGAFIGKILLCSATHININIPTCAGQAMGATYASTRNVIMDVSDVVCDAFILLNKTSNALGINRVLLTTRDILLYIPEALFC
ncbi:MAG: hypothetical protein H0W88_01705 [Parachlamydiaceae bacterium]|nr:hypothetical protein [Parachlamydiaceae bacterium]